MAKSAGGAGRRGRSGGAGATRVDSAIRNYKMSSSDKQRADDLVDSVKRNPNMRAIVSEELAASMNSLNMPSSFGGFSPNSLQNAAIYRDVLARTS